ncbi:CHAT domain-containing protein [Rhizohabitans arisaemae]|uniref:CHAT domain-containing protein n=1 Tax=Rhizohabitans arisaemae TaxID=2720610 RepID=UPI0024B20B7F|nr:hypothetical protein [Rhizohabitans arisaemae]
MGIDTGETETSAVPPPRQTDDPRAWCAVAVARLAQDEPGPALEASRQAVTLDPGGEWGYRLASLALERLGRAADATDAAETAVRLAPGSWAARLRFGGALKRMPGRWREAWAQARRAVRFAPEHPDPHVLIGDLSLLRGDHRRAGIAYRNALHRDESHVAARVNLALTRLRWERPRTHHDPAWPVDPRQTARTRRAVEVWIRRVRVLLALATAATAVLTQVASGFTVGAGAAALLGVGLVTVLSARRIPAWSYLPDVLARDRWLTLSGGAVLAAVPAFAVAVFVLAAVPPAAGLTGAPAVWGGLAAFTVCHGIVIGVLRLLAGVWRGRPVAALRDLAAALAIDPGDRAARRNADVTLWGVVARLWCFLVPLALLAARIPPPAPLIERFTLPAASAGGVVLLVALIRIHRRGGLVPHLPAILRADRRLGLACAATLVGIVLLIAAPVAGPAAIWPPALILLLFLSRAAPAWWSGGPGPLRSSLILGESPGPRAHGEVVPAPELRRELRRAFITGRDVVLSYVDATGWPRMVAVGAVTGVGSGGELSIIAGEEAWAAALRDPRAAVYVSDPADRRFWVEIRGVALPDEESGTLRITPKEVVLAERPGRHQGRGHS